MSESRRVMTRCCTRCCVEMESCVAIISSISLGVMAASLASLNTRQHLNGIGVFLPKQHQEAVCLQIATGIGSREHFYFAMNE